MRWLSDFIKEIVPSEIVREALAVIIAIPMTISLILIAATITGSVCRNNSLGVQLTQEQLKEIPFQAVVQRNGETGQIEIVKIEKQEAK